MLKKFKKTVRIVILFIFYVLYYIPNNVVHKYFDQSTIRNVELYENPLCLNAYQLHYSITIQKLTQYY